MMLFTLKAELAELKQQLKSRFDPTLVEIEIMTNLDEFDLFETRVKGDVDFRDQVVCI